MLFLFSLIMFYIKENSDLWAHADIAQKKLFEGALFSQNFLMYLCANILSGFSGNIWAIRVSLVILISVAETAKYIIVKKAFNEFSNSAVASFCSISLSFVYIIPILYFLKVFGIFANTSTMYLSYFVPNVWHNSTIICSMPFAIASYNLSVKQLDKYERKRGIWIILWLALSILVKPSFFFVFAVAYPLITLMKCGIDKTFRMNTVSILICSLIVAYEYYTIYIGGGGGGRKTLML